MYLEVNASPSDATGNRLWRCATLPDATASAWQYGKGIAQQNGVACALALLFMN